MKARAVIEAEANPLAPFMAQATQEILDDESIRVHFGPKGTPGKRPVTGFDINCGMCEDWAERVAQLYREATGQDEVEVLEPYNLTGKPEHELMGHVFIRFRGRFYDPECSEGTDTWENLPLFLKNGS